MTSRYARNFAFLLMGFLLLFVWSNLEGQHQRRIRAIQAAEYNEQAATNLKRMLPPAITVKPISSKPKSPDHYDSEIERLEDLQTRGIVDEKRK